jgi:nucleolar MIF4G domain-containing protein 1
MAKVLEEVEGLYRVYPRIHVTSTITNLLFNVLSSQQTLLDTFVILHAGFVAALYRVLGTDFGAHLIQSLIERFDELYKVRAKEGISLLVFLSELYNFGVVGPGLVYDLIRMFLEGMGEYDTEILLKVVQSKNLL